jgi:hypothetical protein
MQYPVTITDLPALKLAAKCLSDELANATELPQLSSFARCDMLARALGYHGFSDLTYKAKQRQQSAKHPVGNILLKSSVKTAIIREINRSLPDYVNALAAANIFTSLVVLKAGVTYQINECDEKERIEALLDDYLCQHPETSISKSSKYYDVIHQTTNLAQIGCRKIEDKVPMSDIKSTYREISQLLETTQKSLAKDISDYDSFCKNIDPDYIITDDDRLFCLYSDKEMAKIHFPEKSSVNAIIDEKIANIERAQIAG